MSFIHSIILGIMEGFTEFLPVSSTAHLILTSKLLHIDTSEFLKTFEISIQLGAITSVVFLYFKTFIKKWDINKKILVAFIPTGVIGLVFYKLVKDYFLVNPMISVYSLLVGGIFLILFELKYKDEKSNIEDLNQLTYSNSFLIGCCQSLSIIPGISRAAATMVGGMSLGIKRKTAVEFSFLLAVPTMLAATGLDIVKSYKLFTPANLSIIGVGFLVSFLTAILSISFLLKFIKNNNFIPFGIYRIILSLLFIFFLR